MQRGKEGGPICAAMTDAYDSSEEDETLRWEVPKFQTTQPRERGASEVGQWHLFPAPASSAGFNLAPAFSFVLLHQSTFIALTSFSPPHLSITSISLPPFPAKRHGGGAGTSGG